MLCSVVACGSRSRFNVSGLVLCVNSVVLVILIYFGFMVVGGLDWFAAYVLGLFAISFVGCVCLLDLWVFDLVDGLVPLFACFFDYVCLG